MNSKNNFNTYITTFSRPIPEYALVNFIENYEQLPELLFTKELSKIINVKTGTLDVWACTGKDNLPFIKIGRSRQYKKSDVKAFIESRTFNHTGEIED